MSLVNDLENLENIGKSQPELNKTIKEISKSRIELYLKLEDEFFKIVPDKFYRGKLLRKVVEGKTIFLEELEEMGAGKFLTYGDKSYNINLFWDNDLLGHNFESNLRIKLATLDSIIIDLYSNDKK